MVWSLMNALKLKVRKSGCSYLLAFTVYVLEKKTLK
jgi:hypothetical protein